MAACKDDCSHNLSITAKLWFANMGSTEIWHVGYREGFAFIGVSGRQDAVEKRARVRQYEVSVQFVFKLGVDFVANEDDFVMDGSVEALEKKMQRLALKEEAKMLK